jgi:hypothetical protein
MVVHVGLDLSLGFYLTAAVKVVTGLAGVFILNAFCEVDLGLVSWVVIATPFLMTALATSLAMGLNLDRGLTELMKEKFTPLTADDKMNRDEYVTQLKGGEAPFSTSSMY